METTHPTRTKEKLLPSSTPTQNSNTIETPEKKKKRGRSSTKKSTSKGSIPPNEEDITTTTTTTLSASSTDRTKKASSRSESNSSRRSTKRAKIPIPPKIQDSTIEPEGYEDSKASLHRNNEISLYLHMLAEDESLAENKWKALSLHTAAKVIRSLPWAIKTGTQARSLPGVGVSIGEHIDDFINGLDKSYYSLNSTAPPLTQRQIGEQKHHDERKLAMQEFLRVYGIGDVKANSLYVDHHIKNLEELKKRLDLLTPAEKIGLMYVDELETPIFRPEVAGFEKIIKNEATNMDPKMIVEICGSYRRNANEIGDIDVLISHQDYRYTDIDNMEQCVGPHNILSDFVTVLRRKGIVSDVLGLGPTKFMGIVASSLIPSHAFVSSSSSSSSSSSTNNTNNSSTIHRRIDIRLVPYDSWPFALLYFTGSRPFNVRLRKIARNANYILNEYGVRPIKRTRTDGTEKLGSPVPLKTEQDIFRLLKVEYLEPARRLT